MARPLRPDLHGAWYHVINRGADRQDIYSSDSDRVRFENLLGKAVDEFGIEIHAYCLMTTHYHALVHCPVGALSPALKLVQGEYAGTYNFITERTGPLFEGRFRSILVTSAEQRHRNGRYVHRNALDIVPAAALASYRWSSLGVYAGQRVCPDWLTTAELTAPHADPAELVDAVLNRVDSDRQAERPSVTTQGFDDFLRLEALVAEQCGVSLESMRTSSPGRLNEPRLLAITLAVERRMCSTSALAHLYGFADRAAVRATARRGRVRQSTDGAFAELRQHVLLRPSA